MRADRFWGRGTAVLCTVSLLMGQALMACGGGGGGISSPSWSAFRG